MAAIVVFVKCVLAGHKVTTQWGHKVTVLPGVTIVDFHSDVVISDCLTKLPSHFHSYVTFIIINPRRKIHAGTRHFAVLPLSLAVKREALKMCGRCAARLAAMP